jgi:hypothetical protein
MCDADGPAGHVVAYLNGANLRILAARLRIRHYHRCQQLRLWTLINIKVGWVLPTARRASTQQAVGKRHQQERSPPMVLGSFRSLFTGDLTAN